jgi:predicted glycosyltransferase
MNSGEVTAKKIMSPKRKKIWIDLDNSPHVPFFLPIIKELRQRGHDVFLTVCQLLEFHYLPCTVLGRHWGKSRPMKVFGTCLRALQLMPLVMAEKPDLAVSHGSRAQSLSAIMAGVPNIVISDYEFVSKLPIHPDWAFVPHMIPETVKIPAKRAAVRYPGLKEEVYIQELKPDPSVCGQLGLDGAGLVVTVRPPATEAHYHNAEAELLLEAALDLLICRPDARVILLPRNERQGAELRKRWAEWISSGKIIIPNRVVDGLNLIWLSDLVISGGGTMNREAAALGVPVYSIFRGKIGAVDRYLADTGRLTLLESVEDVKTKVVLQRKPQIQPNVNRRSPALQYIVERIISIAEHQCLPQAS